MFERLEQLLASTNRIGTELDKRISRFRRADRYYDGESPLPQAIVKARVTRAYRMLMGLSEAPWGALVADSAQDRLEVSGVHSEDADADGRVWRRWHENNMESESHLAHNTALIGGRAFALVWADASGAPTISLDTPEQMIVKYEQGSRHRRAAALRRWVDDETDTPHAIFYGPDALYKLKGPKNSSGQAGTQWQREEIPGEPWPLPNPLGRVPVVELPVNRRLKATAAASAYGFARGDYEHCEGLIDRINLLTFLGLVVAFWMGFPLRGILGGEITSRVLLDDNNQPIIDPVTNEPRTEDEPPFEAGADTVFQIEDPTAKVAEFQAADRKLLSVYPELDHLSTITHTPRHYFPMEGGMINIAADAIRADEGGLNAKCGGHQRYLGGGWDEVNSLVAQIDGISGYPGRAGWADRQSRSIAEQADAAVKMGSFMPWQWVASAILGLTDDEISRLTQERASDPMAILMGAATAPMTAPGGPATPPETPPAPPAGVAAGNGAG